ncbi:unnamed protein product [Euphydryas editha]|uniref:HAT C-terminal dimerisation domain-containing protein n=1 Tax=Euphydryas editha TaxID=104508 RepID=A0AAU9VEP8_EUPED|nr:unnamed protein product [Euphydryas editha]
MLQANEIVVLKDIEKILKPFHSVTEEMSAEKYVTSSKAIPIIKCLRTVLDTFTPISDLAKQLKHSLQSEFNKRFENIQKVHLFSVATFLDPRFKKIHLDDDPLSLSKTITYTNKCLNWNTKNDDNSGAASSESSVSSATVDGHDIWQVHREKIMALASNLSMVKNAELDLYVAAPLSNLTVDPLNFWKSSEGTFPKLTELALKHLSVMATSAPSERLFSKAGNMVRKTRNRILGKRLSKLLFLNCLPENLW